MTPRSQYDSSEEEFSEDWEEKENLELQIHSKYHLIYPVVEEVMISAMEKKILQTSKKIRTKDEEDEGNKSWLG
ncbi:hypothetical protein FRX31_031264, partial [Thalictrum thalictroides]